MYIPLMSSRIFHRRRQLVKFLLTGGILFFLSFGGKAMAEEEPLLFGLPPYANPAAMHQSFAPLVDYLSEALGRKINLVISPNYMSHIRRVGREETDLAFLGPSPYVKVEKGYGGVELLAKMVLKNQANDRVVIVTAATSDISSLAALAGRTFAFGDHHSYGSHFMPRFILREHGVSLADLAAYDYLGSHDNVLLSVLHRDFDAGGVRQDIYLKYRDRELRLLHGPVAIAPHVIVCRRTLSPEIKEKLRLALVSLEDRTLLAAINPAMHRFMPVEDAEFDEAREIVNLLESQ
jgi:phosphonate transport system substrate-binding protein